MKIGDVHRVKKDTNLMPRMNLDKLSQKQLEALFDKIITIPKGEYFKVTDVGKKRSIMWYRVEWRSKQGWVNSIALL
jgi:hypothetical protein